MMEGMWSSSASRTTRDTGDTVVVLVNGDDATVKRLKSARKASCLCQTIPLLSRFLLKSGYR